MSARVRTVILVACVGGVYAGSQLSQAQGGARAAADQTQAPGLALQRSVAIYNYRTTAQAGPSRGEEIYYFKCWMCHNSYTVAEGTGAGPLKGLYERGTFLITGEPVNDKAVAEKIRSGGPRMPAFRHSLTDVDMADLLMYLKDEMCCFEDEPPLNPHYRR